MAPRAARPGSLGSWGLVGLCLLALTACGGGGGSPAAVTPAPPAPPPQSTLNADVRAVAQRLGLTGDPASPRGAVQVTPAESPMVKLGQLLFFSQTLAAGYDVSCGTCHHPALAGADRLSIGVGVVPVNAAAVGPGRRVDPARDLDPAADGGPNMHRNTQTTFNAALFDRALLHDGRVFVTAEETIAGGRGQPIQTPESGQRSDPDPVSGLIEFQAKQPFVNDNEMRSFFYTEYGTATEYREHLVRRLRGEVDTEYNLDPAGPENWLARFRTAFDAPAGSAAELMTMPNIQQALGAYVASQVFVDTPWQRFLGGDNTAISDEAKRGALLFYDTEANGGLGCAGCHAGDRMTDEGFHNVGFPQIGRGFQRADKSDLGRWLKTLDEADRNAFRTPGLINVAETAPFGHAGTFDTLEDLLAYHADPRRAVDTWDFGLNRLAQYRDAALTYPHAEPHTRAAIAAPSFSAAEARLPQRALATFETARLVAFLRALTDPCLQDPACVGRWTPAAAEDPDGNMLVRDESLSSRGPIDASNPGDYPSSIALAFPGLPALATFADVTACPNGLGQGNNSGANEFLLRSEAAFGLTDAHDFSSATWFEYSPTFEITMIAGGVTAGYLDADCWPDLLFAAGDNGMITYRNLAGSGFERVPLLPVLEENRFTGSAMADLDGDYRREILLGNFRAGDVPLFSPDAGGRYTTIGRLPVTRTTFGISFAPLDTSGYPYFYLAHWSGSGTAGTAPALWRNDGASVYPWDRQAGTTSTDIDQRFNFTPGFADFTGDGITDLVVASDFLTSVTLHGAATATGPTFTDQTNRTLISDENGMGAAIADFDNDGRPDWFVTSVYGPSVADGNWGSSGNRLYRNVSTAGQLAFEDVTAAAGVRDGLWGWGACAADFNNDGHTDIFHVNGFGYIPYEDGNGGQSKAEYDARTQAAFQYKPARLFMNQGDGSFAEQAAAWQINRPSEGRGLACLDHDRDGDIDIVVLDHSTGLQFFENRSGAGTGRAFLNVRLVGAAPNTDAIGARVSLSAATGGSTPITQLRLSQANSNFSSQNTPDLHFGLGQATSAAELRIAWPDGTEWSCPGPIAANQFLVLDQRTGPAGCPAPAAP